MQLAHAVKPGLVPKQ